MTKETIAANNRQLERATLRYRYSKLYKRWQEFGCQTNPWTVNIVRQMVNIKTRLKVIDSLEVQK